MDTNNARIIWRKCFSNTTWYHSAVVTYFIFLLNRACISVPKWTIKLFLEKKGLLIESCKVCTILLLKTTTKSSHYKMDIGIQKVKHGEKGGGFSSDIKSVAKTRWLQKASYYRVISVTKSGGYIHYLGSDRIWKRLHYYTHGMSTDSCYTNGGDRSVGKIGAQLIWNKITRWIQTHTFCWVHIMLNKYTPLIRYVSLLLFLYNSWNGLAAYASSREFSSDCQVHLLQMLCSRGYYVSSPLQFTASRPFFRTRS